MKIDICSECKQTIDIYSKGKCYRCYRRKLLLDRQESAPKIKCQCSPDCKTMISSINYDGKSMKMSPKHGFKGNLNPSWKGGFFMRMGYKWIYDPKHHFADKDGYVAEHRYLYEQYHNCCLLPWVIIHHKNEIKTDNRLENLEVWNRSEHQNIHNPRKGYRKDLNGRTCLECGSDKTFPSKNGQPHWCRHPITKAEWICETCYKRISRRYVKAKHKDNIINRICLKCGIDKSENDKGHFTWRKFRNGYICKLCFDRYIR